MSPENATIIIIDDDKPSVRSLITFLTLDGHKVIGTAYTFEEGGMLIDRLKNEGKKPDVGLFDGNLSEGAEGGWEGRELASKARETFPGISVISISGNKQEWSDRPNLSFTDGPRAILEAVKEV